MFCLRSALTWKVGNITLDSSGVLPCRHGFVQTLWMHSSESTGGCRGEDEVCSVIWIAAAAGGSKNTALLAAVGKEEEKGCAVKIVRIRVDMVWHYLTEGNKEQDRQLDSWEVRLNETEGCTALLVSAETEGIAAGSWMALSRLSNMCSNKHFAPCCC